MEIKLEQIKPFGPVILKVKIPEKIIIELNQYTDEVVANKERSKKLDHGSRLVANATQEFRIEHDFAKKCGWANFLATCVRSWIEMSMKRKITKFEIIQTWVVRQFKNEFNPVHWHGGHISGAGFLKVPKYFGEHSEEKGDNIFQGGNLNFIDGSHRFLSNSVYKIKPEVGDFYFFPHYLMHTVYPFKDTDEERRSISFNAYIDDDIHNVWGR
tara:strand:- start:42 stop:680 length:639 start_codon:yes stop_codon:yes gene_type:complete